MKSVSTLPVTTLLVAVIAAMALSVARPASAVLIKTGVSTLFADNFENQSLGNQPTTANAQTGTWANAATAYTVVSNTLNPSPGAAEGTKYLRGVRESTVDTLIANFGGAGAGVTSGTVSATFSVYIPVGALDNVLQMSLGPNLDTLTAGLFTAPVWLTNQGNKVYTYLAPGGDASYTDTLVPIVKGVWQTWRIDYTFNNTGTPTNDDTFTVTVDGITSAALNAGGYGNVVDPASVKYLSYRVGAAGTFYLDAPVPEPASLGVLGIGALFLARRRAR